MHVFRADARCIRLAFADNKPHKSLCWSTLTDTWEATYDIVLRVARPNFGLCLDTYNIAGRIFADPSRPDGKMPNANVALTQSLSRLATIDVSKITFIQVVDAEKLSAPLLRGHPFYHAEQPARMSWSRNCRLFYGETDRGAYLPIKQIMTAIFALGFTRGWVSMYVLSYLFPFHRRC